MKYPCDRLAAFMAHCLNSEDSTLVRVNSGALYARLTEVVATRYAEPLLHHPGYAWRLSAEEAATRYFDISLARRLLLSGRVELSIAHRLFEAICRRGADEAWSAVSLRRDFASVRGNVAPLSRPDDFDRCARQLAQLPDTVSPGSASPTIRARSGQISLQLGVLTAAVPEEMSTWDAITCGPESLFPLDAGEPFNRFCGLVIDCVRTAHRPFQELLGLGRGLCPFDWTEVLTIQQARALRKFLALLEEHGGVGNPSSWAIAWDRAPVPGFESVELLRQSEIGLALRHVLTDGAIGDTVEADTVEDGEEGANAAEFLSADEFGRQLEWLQQDGVIGSMESFVLAQLHRGARLAEVVKRADVKMELRRRATTLDAWLADLQHRIEQWPRLAGGEDSV